MLAAVLAGVGSAAVFQLSEVEKSTGYQLAVTALLGFGLYSSTYGIALAEFKSQTRTIVLALTIGVVAKAAIVVGVMYWVFREPDYLVLGTVVAQIDPLAVAASRARSRMSESAKALLAIWSSFDDPVTVLLTIYITAFALRARQGGLGGSVVATGLGSFGLSLLWNLLLAGAVYLAWRAIRGLKQCQGNKPFGLLTRVLLLLAALAVGGIAVWFGLLLALAIIGLFVRPQWGHKLDATTQAATLLATFAVGLVLLGGIALLQAAVLGAAAYLAQIVVALLLTIPRKWRGDRAGLALAQQNGMTAIILALLLEPDFPGTIAIVAPAIVVVNLLYTLCNSLRDRLRANGPEPAQNEATRAEHSG